MTLSLDRTCYILLEECAHVRRGEEVLVVADDLQAPELSAAISRAASKLRAHAISISDPAFQPYREPPRVVLHAMKSVDVVIACATRPIAGGVMDEALKAGARILSIFRITPDALCRTVPIDYHTLTHEMKRVKKLLDASHAIEITSPSGTNLHVQMAKRFALLALGSVRKSGEIDYIPAGTIGIAPREGTNIFVTGTNILDKCPSGLPSAKGSSEVAQHGSLLLSAQELTERGNENGLEIMHRYNMPDLIPNSIGLDAASEKDLGVR